MFNRLYVKLSIALVLLFVLIGTALLYLTRNSLDRYYQEITQRLNASVAMYVTDELQLIDDGQANTDALKQLAHHAMIINPSIEVYLLDKQGRVLSHALGENQVQRQRVNLQPVHNFLKPDPALPLLGDDPRSASAMKVFSAAEVKSHGELEGYVYIVLEGQKRTELANSINNSQVYRLSALALVACLLFGLISALLIFARLSRRLGALTAKADQFCRSSAETTQTPAENQDEIVRLGSAFDAMQARIDLQMEQIRQADEMRRELITNISHDLRTPLTSMLGYIETLLLKQGELDAEQQKSYLEITRNHGQRLGRLVADLFELTKLDSNAVKPQLETFSIAELIQDIAQDFRLSAEQKKISLQVEGDMDAAQVHADIRLMERVIENLLENALRHTPPQGVIRIQIQKQAEGVRVMVSDTGEGITQADLPFIFDRFFHVRNSEQEDLKSTGLGLAIVKRILDMHLAKITVASSVAQGTTFSFMLSS